MNLNMVKEMKLMVKRISSVWFRWWIMNVSMFLC